MNEDLKQIIQFAGYTIKNINYKTLTEEDLEEYEENQFELEVSAGIAEDSKSAALILESTTIDLDKERLLEVSILGKFDIISEELTQEDIHSFISRSGIAILFPYLRSVVSMVSSLDSSDAIILPLINTKVFSEPKKK
nr:protein-export chaperone SecB [Lysinibacillus sphaericus]